MVILKYSEAKLYLAILVAGLGAVFFLWLFLNPDEVADIRRARLFATGFGHFILAPGLFLTCLVASVNLAFVASGDLAAIKSGPDGLYVRSFWKAHHIRWGQLLRIRIEEKVYNRATSYSLLFDVADGGLGHSIKLALHHTRAGPANLPALLTSIESEWQQAKLSGKARAGQPAGLDGAQSDFDPDAAIQRYLARKQAGLVEVAAAAEAAPPPRPAFGRKGLG